MGEKKANNIIGEKTIKAIAKLSNLSIHKKKQRYFARQFNETLKTINTLQRLDTAKVPPTNQVTGITNTTREDAIDSRRILSQQKVLSTAKRTHNGYFVVEAIFDEQ